MITKQELNKQNYILDDEQSKNIEILLERMNKIRILYNKPMVVTSGVRSKEHQIEIYKDKANRREFPFENGIYDESKVPMQSQHLKGAACDIYDDDGSLMLWCRTNVIHLETIGLWIEDDPSTPRVHFQIYPPKSGSRFFKP